MIFGGADNPMTDPEALVADWPLWVRVVAKTLLAVALLALVWGMLVIT